MKKVFLVVFVATLGFLFTACEKNGGDGSSELKTVDQLAAMYHKPFQTAIGVPLNWGFKEEDKDIQGDLIEYTFSKSTRNDQSTISLNNYNDIKDYVDGIFYECNLPNKQVSLICNWLKHHGDKIILDGVTYCRYGLTGGCFNEQDEYLWSNSPDDTMDQIIEHIKSMEWQQQGFHAELFYMKEDEISKSQGNPDFHWSSIVWLSIRYWEFDTPMVDAPPSVTQACIFINLK